MWKLGGFVRSVWRVVRWTYFPMQNLSKIFPRTSSGVTSPRMEERWWRAWRRSSERRSGVWEVAREDLTSSRDAAALIRDW